MRLTVSYAENEVDISFDYEGLDHLIEVLSALKTYKAPDHDHLMSAAWGGDDLTTEEPLLSQLADHLSLSLVGDDGGRDEVGSRVPIYRDGHRYGERKPRPAPAPDE